MTSNEFEEAVKRLNGLSPRLSRLMHSEDENMSYFSWSLAKDHAVLLADVLSKAADWHRENPNSREGIPTIFQSSYFMYLRGFLWEAISSLDLLHQTIVARFHIPYGERAIRIDNWRKVPAPTSYLDEWAKINALLAETHAAPWFLDLQQYRNVAHRSILTANVVVGQPLDESPPVFIVMLPGTRNEGPDNDLLTFVSTVLNKIADLGYAVNQLLPKSGS